MKQPSDQFAAPAVLGVLLAVTITALITAQSLDPTTTEARDPLGPISAMTGLLLRDDVAVDLIQRSSGDRAWDDVARLAQWDRSQVSDGYAHAAEWVSEEAARLGLEDVRIERFPSARRHPPSPSVCEYNGTWAWFSTHLHDRVTRVANLNFDMLGENLRTTNGVFTVSYTPDSDPSWLNGLMESILDCCR